MQRMGEETKQRKRERRMPVCTVVRASDAWLSRGNASQRAPNARQSCECQRTMPVGIDVAAAAVGLVWERLEKRGLEWTGRGVKQERGARIGSVSLESCLDTALCLSAHAV